MYNFFKPLLLPVFLLASGSLNAATVDIDGKIYQVPSPVNVALSAKLGETTTVSYAYDVGLEFGTQSADFDTLFDDALATGKTGFTELYPNLEYLSVADNSNSAFSLKVHQPLGFGNPLYRGPNYLLFDLTFAPTVSTITADNELANSDPNAPRVFTAEIYTEFVYNDYEILGPVDDVATQVKVDQVIDNGFYTSIFTHNGYTVVDVFGNDTLGPTFSLFGTVAPATTSVSAVPVPGSLAMMGLGLLALGALKRRKI